MKFVLETSAAKTISAYILMKGKKVVGKILVHHGNGKTFVNLWIDGLINKEGSSLLYGQASGYGYNKENAALAAALGSVKFKLGKWNKELGGYEKKPTTFDYEKTSKVDSSGPRALEDILKITVLQAI